MAGERSVRISFEAREELSRAIQQIDKSLDALKGSLSSTGATLKGTDVASEDFQRSLDEVQDEATEATVSLAALGGELGVLDAQLSGVRGTEIDIELDDPETTDVERVRSKVIAKLAAGDSPDLDLGADISERELQQALARADTWIEGQSAVDKPASDLGVDLDESALIKEVRRAERIAEESSGDIDLGADVLAGDAAEEVRETTEAIEASQANVVDLSLNVPEGQKTYAMLEVGKATSAIEASSANNVDIEFDVSDEALELFTLASSLSAVQAQAIAASASTRSAARGIDKMGDEAAGTAAEMTALQSVASLMSLNTTALSLNVGAFNIALANLATQIPILISLLGTLATVIMGVAGAAALAGTAFAGVVAGGFVAELERVSNEFENIEGRAEAMQAIMQSMVDVFLDAFDPLIQAGDEMNIFFETINNLLETINVFSKAIADSMSFSADQMDNFIEAGQRMGLIDDSMSDAAIDERIMSVGEFFGELGNIWQENVDDIIRATKIMSAFLLPVLADIIEYFIAGFDDMILFVTRFTNELAVIGPALADLVTFATELVDLGSSILQGLLPVFVGVLAIATEIAAAFNALNPQIVRNAAGMALMGLMASKLHTAMVNLGKGIAFVAEGTMLESAARGVNLSLKRGAIEHTYSLATAKRFLTVVGKNLRSAISMENALLSIQNSLLGRTASFIYSAIAAKAAYAAASLRTAAANFVATASSQGLMAAFAGVGASAWAAVPGISALTTALSLATVVEYLFLAPLLPIYAALAAIVAIGALTVGVLGNMESVTSGLAGVLQGLKTILSVIVNVALEIFITTWNTLVRLIRGSITVWSSIANAIIGFIPGIENVGEAVSFVKGIIDGLIETFKSAPSAIDDFFDFFASKIEDFVNMLPDWLLEVFGVEGGEFEFREAGEGLTVSRDDVVSGSEDAGSAIGSITGNRANQFNYNEENISNTSQEINADPEDEETLKRVVKDAMAEANSFHRRQQGGM